MSVLVASITAAVERNVGAMIDRRFEQFASDKVRRGLQSLPDPVFVPPAVGNNARDGDDESKRSAKKKKKKKGKSSKKAREPDPEPNFVDLLKAAMDQIGAKQRASRRQEPESESSDSSSDSADDLRGGRRHQKNRKDLNNMASGIWEAIMSFGSATKFLHAVAPQLENPRNKKELEALAPIIDKFHSEGIGIESAAFVMLIRRFAGVHAADVYKDWTLGSIVADEMAAETLIPHNYVPVVWKYTTQLRTLQSQKKPPARGDTKKPESADPKKDVKATRVAK